jgi:rhodanese-related sulfurtransferase
MQKAALVLDVRSDAEWTHPRSSHNMPGDLASGFERIPKDQPPMSMCGRGYRSSAVSQVKVADGSSSLTQIHHCQAPMRIMEGKSDAVVVWASEVRFQEQVGNPLQRVQIPDGQNVTAVYAAGMVKESIHRKSAEARVAYLSSPEAQSAYRMFGYLPVQSRGLQAK